MKKIEAFVRPEKLGEVRRSLAVLGHRAMINYDIWYRGTENEIDHQPGSGASRVYDFMPKVRVELVVKDEEAGSVTDAICDAACTDRTGDGKIFVMPVETAVRIQTRERGDTVV